jgi:glycerol kinase
VLEGVAQRGRDLVDAAEADAGVTIDSIRIDGGMSANDVFVDAFANAVGRPVELSPVIEATTLGAGYLAGIACGHWANEREVSEAFSPRAIVEPSQDLAVRELSREQFLQARQRSERTIPDLSGISF